ncbi:MAG: NAD-dependent succinate-semialdehyde dehydrogenase [Magnetovibrio sp.]|nr:NAD-dependent succinate-semialdehyde dehydrogenase [Magnetovibrio sp.]
MSPAKISLSSKSGETITDYLKNAGLLVETAYINGQWIKTPADQVITVTNPFDGSVIGTVPSLDQKAVTDAIDGAEAAFAKWSQLLPHQRAQKLRIWGELMLAEREDLGLIMTLEQGKPLAESMGEIDYAASFFDWFAGVAERNALVGITPHLARASMVTVREPVGICALITPWNFPSAMITRKAAAALAVGCTVVVKPASETPFSALALAVLAEKAGIPKGVFNVVTGKSAVIAKTMCDDVRVRALSFTGSTKVGRLLLKWASPLVKKVSMELGGHAPFIVFEDVDIDHAVQGAIAAKFQTSGQDCLAANRIYIHHDILDEFIKRFTKAVGELKVGDGMEPGTEIGPLMNDGSVNKCIEHVQDAIRKGAVLHVGGKVHSLGKLFFQPTVLAPMTPDMLIANEETFGPVAAITGFSREEDVIKLANATEYGLAAYVYTKNGARAARMAGALEFGMIAINRVKMTGGPVPFGGVKQSGLGREGGEFGMDAFSNIKFICSSLES